MFQRSTFALFVARDKKSSGRVVERQPALQLRDKCFCSFPRRVINEWLFTENITNYCIIHVLICSLQGDLLIVNPLTAEPYCGCDPVLLRQYYFAPLQLCYEHHTRGPCEAGLLFSYNHTTATTSCDCGAKSPNYHPGTGHCYQFQTKGPCRKGQEFRKGSGGGECSCRPGYVHWSANGECYKAFTPGPCNNSEFIVPDKRRPIEENSGRCVENPCPRAHLYFPTSDGQSGQDSSVKCHKVGSRGPCPLGQLVVFEKYSGKSYRGECGCSPGYNQNYWPEDERCYEWYTRGPCKESFLFQYNRDSGKTECVCDEHEGFVFWNETGKCYRLYTQGPCPNYAWLIPGDAPGEVFCECRTGFHFDPDSYSCLPLFSSPPLAMPLTMSEPAGVDWARGIFVTPGAERRSDRGEPDYSWLTSSRWARGGRSRTFFQQRPFSRKSASFRHRQPYQQHRQY